MHDPPGQARARGRRSDLDHATGVAGRDDVRLKRGHSAKRIKQKIIGNLPPHMYIGNVHETLANQILGKVLNGERALNDFEPVRFDLPCVQAYRRTAACDGERGE